MKAIRIHQHGSVEVLQIDEIPLPEIEADEVLIKVETAALNHLDLWVRQGIPGVPLPVVTGSEAAGIIVEVGDIAHNRYGLKKGDEVFTIPIRSCGYCAYCLGGQENLCSDFHIPGESIQGVQAEYIAVPAPYVLKKPQNLTWEEAAAFPLTGMTAYHMLVQKARIHPGQELLIYGASSGVGSAAIQIAKIYGCMVITTAGSQEKAEFAEKLGADYVIRYDREPVGKTVKQITNGKGVDVVIEHTGEKTWIDSLRALKKGGKIVTCGATTGPKVEIDLRVLFIKHQQIIGSTMGTRRNVLDLLSLIEKNLFKPVISKIFSFEDVIKAHLFLEQGKSLGKIVLKFE